jgi:SH3-like domain-containing protein
VKNYATLCSALFCCFLFVEGPSATSATATTATTRLRRASLRSSRVNLHVGPGKQYPVEWVFVCKNLPVQIISDFGQWRRIKTVDNTTGWVHKSLLSNKKTLITVNDTMLFAKASKKSKTRAKILSGCPVEETKSDKKWVKVQVKTGNRTKITGWIKRKNSWGA